MYKFPQYQAQAGCKTKEQYSEDNYEFVENEDGTVSLYNYNGTPSTGHENVECCTKLGYTFDISTQKCKWADKSDELFKVIINPEGNASKLFLVEENETCCLNVSFDYLFKFDYDEIHTKVNTAIEEIREADKVAANTNNNNNKTVQQTQQAQVSKQSKSNGGTKSQGGTKQQQQAEEARIEALRIEGLRACDSYVNIFENFTAYFTLEKLNTTTGLLETVFETPLMEVGDGNLYNYIDSTSGHTGFLISGDTGILKSFKDTRSSTFPQLLTYKQNKVRKGLVDELTIEHNSENPEPSTDAEWEALEYKLTDWYQSCWLHYDVNICDQEIISQIENEEINMSIAIKDCCTDFSILLDRVKMVKECSKVDNVEKFISEPPKFEITRVCDNKKSWLSNTSPDERDFELKYRATEYDTNHHKLVINTKEVDLNLSPARAVEQDVWCYISDNNCILEGCQPGSATTYSAFTCPSGFSAETDGDTCTKITSSGTTLNGSLFTVGPAYWLYTHWLYKGTFFTEDITDKPWPISWGSNGNNDTWRGPYYRVSHMVDFDGDPIIHTGFGTKYDDDGTLLYASPDAFNGFFSKYGQSLLPYHSDGDPNPNILWGGGKYSYAADYGIGVDYGIQRPDLTPITEGSDFYNDLGGGLSNGGRFQDLPHIPGIAVGPLMRAGVWSTPYGSNNANNQWIGFSKCLELDETKTYRLGYSADDDMRIKINGEWLVYHQGYGEGLYSPNLSGNTTYGRSAGGRSSYTVVGITLPAGKNYIEMQGVNRGSGPVGFVTELYDATQEELMNMRYESELKSVTVWSTQDEVGNTFPLANLNGYSCPTGYALNTCLPPPYACDKVEKTTREGTQGNTIDCCCPGNPLLAKDYNNKTIELSLDFSITTSLDCADIQTLVNQFSATTVIGKRETLKCGEVYDIGDWTGDTIFDGFWLTTQNDGTIGVYDVYYNNVTDTYENTSNQVDCECCEVISNAFEEFSNLTNQGINTYPSVSWDPNQKRCTYQKCGDDGCIDLDETLTTELSEIDSVKEFEVTLGAELIDVKTRQTASTYPTLRMLYERYNNHSTDYCDSESSSFDYFDMDNFGKSVGDYWIDLIEQVVPATTIWESTYEYKNTVFDTQKYQYRRNNYFFCDDPTEGYPWSAITKESGLSVITETLPPITGGTSDGGIQTCDTVWLMQNTADSQFLGTVYDTLGEVIHGEVTSFSKSGSCAPEVVISSLIQTADPVIPSYECTIGAIIGTVTQTGIGLYSVTAEPNGEIIGDTNYIWSDGQTGQTATGLTATSYSVSIVDTGVEACSAETSVTIAESCACWYTQPEDSQHVINMTTAPILTGSDTYEQVFTISAITINGQTTTLETPYSETMSASTTTTNINWVSANNLTVSGGTTGLTYTNYVEFLNNAFMELGVYPDYHAQLSTAFTRTYDSFTSDSGFYIVRPCEDSFSLTLCNFGVGSWDAIYTESTHDIVFWGDVVHDAFYEGIICNGVAITGGVVDDAQTGINVC